MARIALQCTCGWRFFIAGSTQGWETPCPSCGSAVRISGRRIGDAGYASPGQLAAAKQQTGKRVRFAISLAALVMAGILVWAVIPAAPPSHVPQEPSAIKPRPQPKPLEELPSRKKPHETLIEQKSDRPIERIAERPQVDVLALRREAQHVTRKINLAGVLAETLRLRGMREPSDRMKAMAADWESRLSELVCRFEEVGEPIRVEDHILPGERIAGFAEKDFSALRESQAADLMAGWLRSIEPNKSKQVFLVRGGLGVALYIDIEDLSEEIVELARTPTGDPGTGSDGNAATGQPLAGATPADNEQLRPEELLRNVESALGRLPAGYRRMLPPEDRVRLDEVLSRRAAPPGVQAFLRERILSQAIPALEKDAAHVKARAAALEVRLKDPITVDLVHFKDGRTLSVKILRETETSVQFQGHLGTVTLPKENLRLLEPGKGLGLKFPGELKKAAGRLEALAPLLTWCKDAKLKIEGDYVSCLILATDPANAPAREFLGLKGPF